MMKKTIVVMTMVFVLLAFTAPAMAEECADKSTGIKHYNMGAYDLAEACFRNYLPTNPDAEAHYYLGLIQLLHRNNPSAAFNEFSQAGDHYKNIAAAELRQMAIAIGPSDLGRANTLFEEYVKLAPNANRTEITRFFFHLAVDENMKLIVSEETKADYFAFARGFDPAAAEKLISSYRVKWLAEGKSGIRKDLDAGNYSGVVERMNKLIARGAKPEEIAQASRECLSALMGDPDKGIHGDAYMVGKEAIVEDERICAELGLGKEHVDIVAPRRMYFSRQGSVEIFVNGRAKTVTGVLPWGVQVYSCDDNDCIYNFGRLTEKTPFKVGTTIGEHVETGDVTFGNTPNDKMFCRLYSKHVNGKNRYCMWIPEDVSAVSSMGNRQGDTMYWLVVDEKATAPIWLGLNVKKPADKQEQ